MNSFLSLVLFSGTFFTSVGLSEDVTALTLILGWQQETTTQQNTTQTEPNNSSTSSSETTPTDPSSETDTEETSDETDDEEALENKKGFFDSGVIGLLREGGWFMWPILLMGILAAGVIIERYRSLKMLHADAEGLRSEVLELLSQNRTHEAYELCERTQGPVPAVLSAGLRKYALLQELDYDPARIEEQVVKSMDDYSVHVVAALERHLPVLATISSAAPMLGFLGTVAGMIRSFKDIVAKMGETNIVEAAAGGISEALLTTCFGLIVGIPAFMAFNYFNSVINRFVLDVEESAVELIETVTLQQTIQQTHTDKETELEEAETVR